MLFKGDAYITVELENQTLTFDGIDPETQRRLALDFSITLTADNDPNEGKVTLYNLSETSRNLIAQEGVSVAVFAGYSTLKLIGQGSIKNVQSTRPSQEWKTTMTFGDGQKEYTSKRFSRAYKRGVPRQTVINDITTAMTLPTTGEGLFLGGLEGALTLDGMCKDLLTEKCGDWQVDWSIQDGEIIFTPLGATNKDAEKILVAADTGLLEHPVITERGVKFKTQLNPDIRPKTEVEIKPIASSQNTSSNTTVGGEATVQERNPSATGAYVCDRVVFQGNNYGGAFETLVDGRRIQ